ncbi:endonuclease/exonuclease/phosphatase family protein [Litoribaculum gwangyangense]
MKNLSYLGKIIYFVNITVAVLLLLSYILPLLPPKKFPVLSVLNLGVSLLVLINVIFLLYWLIRRKKQLFLSLFVLLVGYVLFGSIYKFSKSTKIESPNNFKVMNYNVRLFNLFEWISEKDVDTKIVDFIKKEAPDILCIQDFHPRKDNSLAFFKYRYEHLSQKKIKHGQAIFSQFPIVNSGSIEFPNTSNNAIFVDIVKGKDTIRVYNVHLQSLRINTQIDSLKNEDSERLFNRIETGFSMQQFQTELLLKHKGTCQYKVVICGDFNNTAFSYVYRKIKGDLKDTFKEAGHGFGRTYDFKFFPLRIDFIFSDEAFAVNGFKTFEEVYSDHYPIMATLSLKD